MKLYERLSSYAPMLATAVAAACIGISLSGYTEPVYAEPVRTVDETAMIEKDESEKKEDKEVKKGNFDKEDGVYTGTGTGFAGQIRVSVEIKDKTIVAINILEVEGDDDAFFNRAKGVIDKIIDAQSLDVDVVSGATYSSKGIISAVKNALTGETDSGETGAASSGAVGQGSTSIAAVNEPSAYRDGTYTGMGTGFSGPITVQVVISGGRISSIQVLSSGDGDSYMSSASSLIAEILSSQSTNVDTVSGATYSSVGIIEAVRNALSQAAVTESENQNNQNNQPQTETNENNNSQGNQTSQTPEKTGTVPYKDGVYFGVGEGFSGDMTVAVVIQDKTITAVVITESEDDAAFLNRAKGVTENILKKQSTDVDAVSGATFSSNGIIEAVKDALVKADEATNGKHEEPETKETETESEKESESGKETEETKETKPNETEPSETEPDETEPDESEPEVSREVWDIDIPCKPDEYEDFETYILSMTVTLEDGKIIAIEDIQDKDNGANSPNRSFIKKAAEGSSKYKGVVKQILEKGVPEDIDTVSGATCSSKAIINGCLLALEDEETE